MTKTEEQYCTEALSQWGHFFVLLPSCLVLKEKKKKSQGLYIISHCFAEYPFFALTLNSVSLTGLFSVLHCLGMHTNGCLLNGMTKCFFESLSLVSMQRFIVPSKSKNEGLWWFKLLPLAAFKCTCVLILPYKQKPTNYRNLLQKMAFPNGFFWF